MARNKWDYYIAFSLILVIFTIILYLPISEKIVTLLTNLLVVVSCFLGTILNLKKLRLKNGNMGIYRMFLFLLLSATCFVLYHLYGSLWAWIGQIICIVYIFVELILQKLNKKREYHQ